MKVLVNCYACSPYKGSEPGMGWNFVKGLAAHHELHVLTESKFEPDLQRYMTEHPDELANVHFHFIRKERHKKLRKIWPPSYYWFYRAWQKKALRLAMQLEKKEHFDLVHQLNMVGYREPGYLWKMGKPLVWGPMGGFNVTPWKLLPTMGLKGCLFYAMRNVINLWQMHHLKVVRNAVENSDVIISATEDDRNAVLNLWNKQSEVIPEVGFVGSAAYRSLPRNGKLKICWSGLHIPRKSLNLLIEALGLLPKINKVELHVLGDGECTKRWKSLAKKLKVSDCIVWHGWVDKEQAQKIMAECHVFVITSLSDATSTVLLEALSKGLPVIATNHLGFANVVTQDSGIKIDLHNYNQVVRDFAQAIDSIESDEAYRQSLSRGAFRRAQNFSWEGKIREINEIYEQAVNAHLHKRG